MLITTLLVAGTSNAMDVWSLSGTKTNVTSLKNEGMWTLVMIWSLDCVACEEQKPMINRFHKDYSFSNAHVIGLASDGHMSWDVIEKRVFSNPDSFPHYVPLTTEFRAGYLKVTGVDFRVTPTYLMFNPQGTLEGIHTGKLKRDQLEVLVGPALE